MLSASAIPRPEYIRGAWATLVHRTVQRLKQLPPGINGGSGLKNYWEDFCVQVQGEGAFLELYRDFVAEEIRPLIRELPSETVLLLWLGTDESDALRLDSKTFDTAALLAAVSAEDIAAALLTQVLNSAMDYSNARTRGAGGN